MHDCNNSDCIPICQRFRPSGDEVKHCYNYKWAWILLKEVGWRNYWPAGLECQGDLGGAVECGRLK